MSSTGINTLTSGTINGLTSLDLTDLTTDTLNADNIDGEFFSIQTIEANDVQVDNELELTNNGFITIGKNTAQEITITDTQVGFLNGVTSNIQTQINNTTGDTSQLRIDLTEAQDDINDNQSLLGLQGATIDDLYVKTILQSASSIQQKTTFSGKLILSSLSNLDVGVDIQANTANVGILTTSVSNLSTQQTTNTFNIQQQGLSIGQASGPSGSLFNRVQNITAITDVTYNDGTLLQLNSDKATTHQITLNDGVVSIRGDAPNINFYRTDSTGGGQSSYIVVGTNSELQIQNYQQNQNILISTASGSSSAEININSNYVKANGVDINAKFNTNDANITQINSDILGLSNTTSSLNIQQVANTNAISANDVDIANNLSKLTLNTNSIQALQVKVPPVGSIMMYAGSTSPDNWYICDGALISKSLNIELWGLLGNTYLNGRTPQTLSFYLPDMRQLFVTGAGDNSTYPVQASVKSVGEYSGQSIQQHTHEYEKANNSTQVGGSFSTNNVWNNNTTTTNTSGVKNISGVLIPNNSETRPYCMAMNYIIKK